MRQRAKALEPEDVRRLRVLVQGHRHPQRDDAIILLSLKAGLRACEVAGLRQLYTWESMDSQPPIPHYDQAIGLVCAWEAGDGHQARLVERLWELWTPQLEVAQSDRSLGPSRMPSIECRD